MVHTTSMMCMLSGAVPRPGPSEDTCALLTICTALASLHNVWLRSEMTRDAQEPLQQQDQQQRQHQRQEASVLLVSQLVEQLAAYLLEASELPFGLARFRGRPSLAAGVWEAASCLVSVCSGFAFEQLTLGAILAAKCALSQCQALLLDAADCLVEDGSEGVPGLDMALQVWFLAQSPAFLALLVCLPSDRGAPNSDCPATRLAAQGACARAFGVLFCSEFGSGQAMHCLSSTSMCWSVIKL